MGKWRQRRNGDKALALSPFAAAHLVAFGTKRRFAATHEFGRFGEDSGHPAKSMGTMVRRY
jgi:hypothetical protein